MELKPSLKKYDVFLSFRGPDVRKTLVDHLYGSLTDAGLSVYWDERSIEKGECIDEALKRAIKDSAICIIIFSRNYVSSASCLLELTHMYDCKSPIKPLFYDVHPHQVRHAHAQSRPPGEEYRAERERNPYSEALKEHIRKGRYPLSEIEQWGESLKKVSNIHGWTLESTHGYEGRLVRRVVSDVVRELGKLQYQKLPKHHVQLERIEEVVSLLNIDNREDVLKMGICGFDGFGKTTIAKAVFNRIVKDFDACCFISDMSSKWQHKDGLRELQEQLMKDLHLRKDCRKDMQPEEGRLVVPQDSALKRILVVLDNVADSKQLEILKEEICAGPGSRIIVTTPDKHVLNMAQICTIYKMEGLEYDEALTLFSLHASLSPEHKAQYAQQSERIVKTIGGMPLALEIVGGFLSDKVGNPECWNEALNTPQSICHQKIFNELRPSSYGKLTFQEKNIFLDIALLYIGKKTEHGIRQWKMMNWDPHTAIKSLEFKSLLTIVDDRFMMHSLLRDMGEAISKTDETRNKKDINLTL